VFSVASIAFLPQRAQRTRSNRVAVRFHSRAASEAPPPVNTRIAGTTAKRLYKRRRIPVVVALAHLATASLFSARSSRPTHIGHHRLVESLRGVSSSARVSRPRRDLDQRSPLTLTGDFRSRRGVVRRPHRNKESIHENPLCRGHGRKIRGSAMVRARPGTPKAAMFRWSSDATSGNQLFPRERTCRPAAAQRDGHATQPPVVVISG